MANPQLVRIPTPGKDKVPLSKAQKEFNRLTQKIEQLETDLTQFRAAAESIQQRIHTEYEPLVREYNELRANLVRVFDRAHDRTEATKTERKKLADLILNISYDLISEQGMDELKPIFDKYDKDGFDVTDAEADQEVSELMKEMVSSMYGITFDENADVSTKEKFMAYLDEQMQVRQEKEQKQQQEATDKRAKKPKTAKQQEREEKNQLEERNITKAVRTLYMDLVKTFHPDREPDDAEKARKTEIMQRVTQAYESSDLLALLRFQLEFNRIDQQHLETLAEDQLKYYNKILRQQADELSNELHGLQSQLSAATGKSFMVVGSALSLEYSFNNDLRELKKTIKATKKDIKELIDPAQMKAFLKTYRIQKEADFDPFDAYFG
jgi:predicted  nucleic acid-binding Zn-ribbon protein